jgi:hypothetical protein
MQPVKVLFSIISKPFQHQVLKNIEVLGQDSCQIKIILEKNQKNLGMDSEHKNFLVLYYLIWEFGHIFEGHLLECKQNMTPSYNYIMCIMNNCIWGNNLLSCGLVKTRREISPNEGS